MASRLTLRYEDEFPQIDSDISLTIKLNHSGPQEYINALMAFMAAVGFANETIDEMVLDKADELQQCASPTGDKP